MRTLEGRRILLIFGGGIAAYKVLELARRLKERGAGVRGVLTDAARNFVTELSVAAITGERASTDLFDTDAEHEIGHIPLSREADLIVVAPATADLLAKMAHGLCDDLASTVLVATDKPVLAAPAMNPRMWAHPATQRNVEQLRADGITFVGPESGEMAERDEAGLGRLAEPPAILAAIEQHFSAGNGPLSGLRAVVTSGPTHEPIDPVRYLANRSSGRQGHAIAASLAAAGVDVTLVSGPVDLAPPPGVRVVAVETAREMHKAVEAALPVDIAIMAAAVADWRVARQESEKIKKGVDGAATLALVENPDILVGLARHKDRPGLLIGFAAETEDLTANAQAKLKRKGADWIVANDVSPETGVMGGAHNRVHLVTAAGIEDWPEMSKADVAERLVERIAAFLAERPKLSPAPGPELLAPAPEAERHLTPAQRRLRHAMPGTDLEPSAIADGSLDIRPTR
jgi:phosphopantothenoylcysteine decarboxylase / phosphopantothenate---cysteine ligase